MRGEGKCGLVWSGGGLARAVVFLYMETQTRPGGGQQHNSASFFFFGASGTTATSAFFTYIFANSGSAGSTTA